RTLCATANVLAWSVCHRLPAGSTCSAGLPWPSWPGRSQPGPNRCPSRGTAWTASTRPTGVGPGHTSTIMSAAECRSGPEPGRTPSSGQRADCVMTSGLRRLRGDAHAALDDRLGDLAHGEAAVHGGLLDPAEGLGLGQPVLGLEQALGPVAQLADLEPLTQRADLAVERADLGEPA